MQDHAFARPRIAALMLAGLPLLGIALGATAARADAASTEPVRHVPVYVEPYYASAPSPGGRPEVSVWEQHDDALASNDPAKVLAVRDAILARPDMVAPTTLMVLAIRLYDVGRRDESVFWFYVARNRFMTTDAVLDMQAPALAQVNQAVRAFAHLAGPYINGYAFCDIPRQQDAARRALAWVEANPYQAVFLPALPARPGDRRENLAKGVERLRAGVDSEVAQLAEPGFVDEMMRVRGENGATARFCWQD